jgi:hypothetical protein
MDGLPHMHDAAVAAVSSAELRLEAATRRRVSRRCHATLTRMATSDNPGCSSQRRWCTGCTQMGLMCVCSCTICASARSNPSVDLLARVSGSVRAFARGPQSAPAASNLRTCCCVASQRDVNSRAAESVHLYAPTRCNPRISSAQRRGRLLGRQAEVSAMPPGDTLPTRAVLLHSWGRKRG